MLALAEVLERDNRTDVNQAMHNSVGRAREMMDMHSQRSRGRTSSRRSPHIEWGLGATSRVFAACGTQAYG